MLISAALILRQAQSMQHSRDKRMRIDDPAVEDETNDHGEQNAAWITMARRQLRRNGD
jgi:hypothetical protein